MIAMAKQILSPILYKTSDEDLKATVITFKNKIDGIYDKYYKL